MLERPGDLAAILTGLEPNDVLFVDEIHRMSALVEEVLYPAMEDYQIDIMTGEGASARSFKIDLPPFTLVGATTRAGLLTAPLRDRFGIVQRLEFYSVEDLAGIVGRSGTLLGADLEPDGALEIARARARHPADRQPAPEAGARLRRDPRRRHDHGAGRLGGARSAERRRARARRDGPAAAARRSSRSSTAGPVGVDNLGAALSEETGTLEEVVEPYLIQQGLLMRTPRGRVVTLGTYRHFGLPAPDRSGGTRRPRDGRGLAARAADELDAGRGSWTGLRRAGRDALTRLRVPTMAAVI